jgi:hypothetical protein
LLASCVKDLDLDQANDFSSAPVFKTTLIYFTLDQIDFFDLVNSVELVTPLGDTSDVTVFNDGFIKDNLQKVILDFEAINTFDRGFRLTIEFLDANDAVTLGLFPFQISANNELFTAQRTIQVSSNELFLSTTKIRVSIRLSQSTDSSNLNPTILQTLQFKSAGTYFLKT